MSAQRQPLQQEEPKARPYRATSPGAVTQYLESTAEPSSILDSTASTGIGSDLIIHPLSEEPSRRNDESLSKFQARQMKRPRSLRPFIISIMAFKQNRKFSTTTSVHRRLSLSSAAEKEGRFSLALTVSHLSLSDPSLSVTNIDPHTRGYILVYQLLSLTTKLHLLLLPSMMVFILQISPLNTLTSAMVKQLVEILLQTTSSKRLRIMSTSTLPSSSEPVYQLRLDV
jgi:hypothetical protein